MWHRYEVRSTGKILGIFLGKLDGILTPRESALWQELSDLLAVPSVSFNQIGETMSFFTDEGHERFRELIDLQLKHNPMCVQSDAEVIYTCLPAEVEDRWGIIYEDEYQVLIGDPVYIAQVEAKYSNKKLPSPGKYKRR